MNGNGSAAVVLIEPQEEEQLRQEVAPVVAQANDLIVKTPKDFEFAATFLKAIKASAKKVTDFFSPMKAASYDAWKKICTAEKTILDPIQTAEKTVKLRMSAWQIEEDRKARAEQRRLQAEAEERARKERERLQAQAAKAAEKGNAEKAEALLEQAETTVAAAVQVETATPKVDGISSRKVWKAEVSDKKAFLAFAAQDVTGMFLATIEINENAISRMAKGEKAPAIPGVTFRRETVMSAGSK